MAGSLNHIVDDEGYFYMDAIENLGDAHEALHECFEIIRELTGGKPRKVCAKLGFPKPRRRMKKSGWYGKERREGAINA